MPRPSLKSQDEINALLSDYQKRPKRITVIDETLCIGCTQCIQACPFDSIIGGAKHMHTVITQSCIGCELCIPPCPVDCIQTIEDPSPKDTQQAVRQAQEDYLHRTNRLLTQAAIKKEKKTRAQQLALRKKNIQEALERVRKKKTAPGASYSDQ